MLIFPCPYSYACACVWMSGMDTMPFAVMLSISGWVWVLVLVLVLVRI
jgi:hypothetical protein